MNYLITLIVLLLPFRILSQEFSKLPTYNLEERDFSFLKPILENKKIVLLGEMTHGDGTTFQLKTEVVKYLHEQLGYNVLALENGMYSFLSWREKLNAEEAEFEDIFKSIPYQWSQSNEMKDLFSYLSENPNLIFTGFDSYDDYLYEDQFLVQIDSLVGEYGIESYGGFIEDFRFLQKHRASKAPGKNRMEAFEGFLKQLSEALYQCDAQNCSFWMRVIDGLRTQSAAWWNLKDDKRKNAWVQNPRDSTMALNIRWLFNEEFKDEKIIVWAANFHVANNVSSAIERHKFFQNGGVKTTGEYLKGFFGDACFSIGTISFKGTYAIPSEGIIQNINSKSKKTLEYYLSKSNNTAFVNFVNNKDFKPFVMSGVVPYLEQKENWGNVYDGVFFIKEMKAATYPDR